MEPKELANQMEIHRLLGEREKLLRALKALDVRIYYVMSQDYRSEFQGKTDGLTAIMTILREYGPCGAGEIFRLILQDFGLILKHEASVRASLMKLVKDGRVKKKSKGIYEVA